jgi:HTH-type transcriptional regulator / antitoxin HigA
MESMRKFRTLDEFAEQYFCDRPEEIDDYLAEIFQEYAEDKDIRALLASLNTLARFRGIIVIN